MRPRIQILTEDALRQHIHLDLKMVDIIERAFAALASGQVVMPPILMADWLHPGLHITAMGADQTGKSEIGPKALAEADLYVCNRVNQCETSGELEAALAAGLWTKGTPPELGQVIEGSAKGRMSEKDITICDLTGTGAQDTAIASHVHSALGNAGTIIDN